MTLVSITNINNLDSATADLFNSRFAAIVAVINGNIDASNIKDNSIPYGKLSLADASIPITKLVDLVVNTGTNANTAGGSTNYVKLGQLLVCWGTTASYSITAGSTTDKSVTFPQTYATAPTMTLQSRANTVAAGLLPYEAVAPTTTVGNIVVYNRDGSTATCVVDWIAIGKAA